MIFQSINPFSKALIAEHEVLTDAQLKQKLELAESAFKNWRHTSFQERGDKMKKLAALLNLPIEVTAIGFKYIADIMTQKDVLVGGEESGGLAVKGHIPERDGIWIGLMILEFMSTTGKSLKELIQEVYDLVGSFWCDRDDLHITESQKKSVIKHCDNQTYTQFGSFNIQETVQMDGTKFLLGDDRWVMIRPSGTEPVLRVYAQAENEEMVRTILDEVKAAIL